jgi:hypothetical protein
MRSPRSWKRRSSFVLGAILSTAALASACSSGKPQDVPSGPGTGPGFGSDGGPSCLKDEPNCPCKHEGAVIQCGKAAENDGGPSGTVKCAMGGEICTDGRWSECQTNSNDPALQSSNGLKLITGIKTKGLTNPGTACSNDPCDPYCMQYPDNANGVDAGDGGVTTLGCSDASVLTVVTTGSPDASTAPTAVLKDAGLADGEGYIFIELPPNTTATRQFVTPQATIKNADIYFLIDDTSSMGAAASNLAAALTNTTSGIITGIKASLPQPTMANPGVGTYFGVGRFEDFYQAPYISPGPDSQSSGCGGEAHIVGCDNWYNLPFQHLLSMQDDIGTNGPGGTCGALSCTAAAVSWLTVDAFDSLSPAAQTYARSGGDIPEGSVAALWMMATGNGSYSTGGVGNVSGPVTVNYPGGANQGQTWWQVPRLNNYWLGVPTGVVGTGSASQPNDILTTGYSAPGVDLAGVPCTGGSGYPCFRAGSTPVIVMMSDAPGHEGPGGQYPHVNEIYSPTLGSSPHLSGANPWPVQPAKTATWPSGGCPAGYGGTIGTGPAASDPCALTTDPTGTDDGLSFATALALPTGTDSLPVPGVYYGIVKGSATPRAPGTAAALDWWSASGVGGGVFNLAAFGGTVTNFLPGFPQRSSLRDCQAGDEAFECTPGVPVANPSPTCFSNIAGGAFPVVTTGLAAGTSTYPNPTGATVGPTQNTPPSIGPLTNSLTPPYTPAGGAQALPAPGAATASSAFATVSTLSGANTETLASTNAVRAWATTPTATYTGASTLTLVSFFKISDINGSYAITPTIPLTAGEEITNVQVTVQGASQGVNLGVTIAATGLNTSTTPATTIGGTSTTTGTYYAGSAGAPITITAWQNASPAAPSTSTNYIELQVTYQVETPTGCATSLIYSSTGAAAECPTCAAQWPYSAVHNACYGPACGGAFPNQGSGANVNTCYATCPTSYSGYTFAAGSITWSAAAGTCTYGCPTTFPSGPVSSGGNNTCYECATGTWAGVGNPTQCTLGCGGSYPNTGSGGTTCYGACAAGSQWCTAVGGVCTAANECNYTCPAEYPGYVAGTGVNSASQCFACAVQVPALTLDQNNTTVNAPTCDYCTAPGALDIGKTTHTHYYCDTCGTMASPTAPTLGTVASAPNALYDCPGSTPACAAGYSQSGATCRALNACINPVGQGYTATGGGASANVGGNPSTTYVLVGNPGPVTGAAGGTQPGVCTQTRTVTTTVAPAGPYTAANCPVGTASSTAMGATQCSTNAEGATCALTTGAACTAIYEGTGGIECQGPGVAQTPTCTMPTTTHGGDGYFGNDVIYTFTVPPGLGWQSRYYYHFALLRGGPDSTGGANTSGTDTWVTGGAPGTSGTIAANAPQPKPFLYIKSDPTTVINSPSTTDSSYPYAIPSTAGATNAAPNGSVIDCNVSAQLSLGNASNPLTDYVVSEIDGYLPPGKYYLVVDNAAPSTYTTNLPAFQYWLQIGGFDDVPNLPTSSPPSLTQPSYNQMITQLKGLQAQFVGVENSGLSCFSNETSAYNASVHFNTATQNYAQYETRDFMEKIAYDVGSEDPTTLRPYVVPVQKDGTACNPTCPNALAAQAAGGTCNAACLAACVTWGAATCASNYPNAPYYDPATQGCTKSCNTNADCPMNTPNCQAGTPNICTSACAGGVAGLSCAVASAVANLTSNLKQNVYLRPIAVNAGSTYTAPGATCVPTMAPSPASAQCTGATTGGTDCYGGTCTTTCLTAATCASGMCEPSTVPGDTNKYCISPAVFIQSVQAVSTPTAVTGSQTVCGIHPGTIPCGMDSQCPPGLPTCLTSGPEMSTCGVNDTGPDTIVPQPSYYNASDPPQDNDGMFNECSPGAQVLFNVTFTMPYQRSAAAQQYEFDLGIYAGAGIVGRTRVILENPALSVADFYRYYDGTVCGSGTHVVWGNFSYNAICPSDGVGDFSQIRFCASTATTAEAGFQQDPSTAQDGANGCAPGEVLLGFATASTNPASTTPSMGTINTCPPSGSPGMGYSCAPAAPTGATPAGAWAACDAVTSSAACPTTAAPGWANGCAWLPQLGFNVGTILQASAAGADAGLATDQYLKIRMEFDPSTPGDVVAPFLYSWNLDIDCVPSE